MSLTDPNHQSSGSELVATVTSNKVGEHEYIRVDLDSSENIKEGLSRAIRETYFDRKRSKQLLKQAASELQVFTGDRFELTDEDINKALAEELDALIPADWKTGSSAAPHLSTQRSELAEIIGTEVLRVIFDCIVPASRIRNKEIPDQATRGADVIGVESDLSPPARRLLLGEVKGSGDSKTPPGVIAGMKSKLTQLATDRRVLLQELLWLRDNSEDEHFALCAQICVAFQLKKQLDLVLVPILIRTISTAQDADPGIFITDPDSFGYCIRFISVILQTEDLYDFAVEIYRMARELDQDEH